jgi:serine protease AprX
LWYVLQIHRGFIGARYHEPQERRALTNSPLRKEAEMFEEREQEQPFNQIVSAHLAGGQIVDFSIEELPRDAFSEEPLEVEKEEEEEKEEERPPEKIHPVLRTLLDERPDDREQLLINLRDDMTLPRFPEPAMDEPRESETNRAVLQRSEELIREITNRRAENYERVTQELSENYEFEVLETYWLVNTMLVEMPLSAVSDLAEREDVVSVEPRYTGEEPPQNPNPNDDVDDGRDRIKSDPLFNFTNPWIGLLDTGVRFTHTQFNNPSNIDFRRDCVNGSADCNTGPNLNPNDDFWNHGTSSAGIITANANQGNAFRGVTRITLDSWKVYRNAGLDQTAVVRAFQNAVSVLDRVIVAEIQGGGDDASVISQAADNAFDLGAVIIAANGNFGPGGGTVNAPANAHKVIGVGAFDVQTLTQLNVQSRGPARDNRIKPDIQAPTNTETASNASDTALRSFINTSGATPYAAGAAALSRGFLLSLQFPIDPGQVYAYLILSGQEVSFENTVRGAGPLRLPNDGVVFFGKVSITHQATIDIVFNVGGGFNLLDSALWWPETIQLPGQATEVHNDIDLRLLDPSGALAAVSLAVPSVFERARVTGAPLASGTWTLRIRGVTVPGGSQTVYWAAYAAPR